MNSWSDGGTVVSLSTGEIRVTPGRVTLKVRNGLQSPGRFLPSWRRTRHAYGPELGSRLVSTYWTRSVLSLITRLTVFPEVSPPL